MDITVRHDQSESVVALTGELDMATAPQLIEAVEGALAASPARLILDMGQVTFCDSHGLGTLVLLNRSAVRAQSYLVITNVGEFLDRVLAVTGLHQALTIRRAET